MPVACTNSDATLPRVEITLTSLPLGFNLTNSIAVAANEDRHIVAVDHIEHIKDDLNIKICLLRGLTCCIIGDSLERLSNEGISVVCQPVVELSLIALETLSSISSGVL